MRISSTDDLKTFLTKHYAELNDDQYIKIMSSTLGVYEHGKPKDLAALLNNIDTHGNFIEKLPQDHEAPLFLIVDYERNV